MTIDDPIQLLKAHQRAGLDRQAELATEARALAQRVEAVTAEMSELKPVVDAYTAILGLIATINTQRATTGTTGTNAGTTAARSKKT